MLAALRAAAPGDAPVLGVACGSLGALSAVAAEQLADALERVWAGDWTARSLPALAIGARGRRADDWAANDCVVVRRGAGQLVADVSVDDELYVRLAGDGLVVATALGSSAYSMAAGGPVLAAGTAAFVCTPLAMHGGSAPPLVVPGRRRPDRRGPSGLRRASTSRSTASERAVEGAELPPHPASRQAHAGDASVPRPGHGLAGLRKRRLITDSPRVLARDARGRRS